MSKKIVGGITVLTTVGFFFGFDAPAVFRVIPTQAYMAGLLALGILLLIWDADWFVPIRQKPQHTIKRWRAARKGRVSDGDLSRRSIALSQKIADWNGEIRPASDARGHDAWKRDIEADRHGSEQQSKAAREKHNRLLVENSYEVENDFNMKFGGELELLFAEFGKREMLDRYDLYEIRAPYAGPNPFGKIAKRLNQLGRQLAD